MRRFLSISFFALALMIGATGVAPVAHADAGGTANGSACDPGSGNPADGMMQDGKCVATSAYTSQSVANQTPITPNQGSSDTAFNPVMSAIAGLFAWLVGVAALTLDYAVYYTVVNMGAYIHKLTAIGVTWRILRDIGNIMLIFGFLAIGISIVLNNEWYASGKKMLPMLLVAAVFLNFSLFFSEAIIDTGNLFATQFYTQINGGVTPTADTLKGITTSNQGISSKLMSQLGLQSIYDVRKNSASLIGNTPWYIGFLAILLFIVTAFVMFSLAFILIARFIILVFLIILAPIGFAGLAVPQLKHKAGQWWSTLFQQTITAPVLLLLLYVALAVITDAQFLTGLGGGSAGAITGFVDNNNLPAFASYMMSFSIAIGLMLAVTISAKGLSAFGTGIATKAAGALTLGATAYGASALLNSTAFGARKALQRYAPDNKATRLAARGLRLGERARMDVRSIPGVSTGLASAGIGGAIGKSAGGRVNQAGDWWKKSSLESDQQYRQETVVPRLNAAVQSALQTGDYKQVGSILSSMSDKDLETSAAHKALVNNPTATALLSQARFDKLQSSDVLTATQKAALAQARKDGDNPDHAQSRFSTLATSTYGATLPGTTTPHPFAGQTRGQALVGTMNTAARGKLAGNILTVPPPIGSPAGTPSAPRPEILNNLNGSDFNAIAKEGALTQSEKTAIGSYITSVIGTAAAPIAAAPGTREATIATISAAPAFRAYYGLP